MVISHQSFVICHCRDKKQKALSTKADMDELARYNHERWEELAKANVLFSRPWLDLSPAKALEKVDPEGMMGEVHGKDVLCLAGSGGQQSAAFAMMGAKVTVLDFSETQLARDRETATHYNVQIRTIQGDMRDLSCFDEGAFDIVWQAHSLNFVPDARLVFGQVARVLRKGGLYRLHCTNPFVHSLLNPMDPKWDGQGYALNQPYVDGAEVVHEDSCWDFDCGDGTRKRVEGPKEFRHSLSTLLNGLIGQGFVILAGSEEVGGDPQAAPGSWEHFNSIAPPWLLFWACYRPDVLAGIIEETPDKSRS